MAAATHGTKKKIKHAYDEDLNLPEARRRKLSTGFSPNYVGVKGDKLVKVIENRSGAGKVGAQNKTRWKSEKASMAAKTKNYWTRYVKIFSEVYQIKFSIAMAHPKCHSEYTNRVRNQDEIDIDAYIWPEPRAEDFGYGVSNWDEAVNGAWDGTQDPLLLTAPENDHKVPVYPVSRPPPPPLPVNPDYVPPAAAVVAEDDAELGDGNAAQPPPVEQPPVDEDAELLNAIDGIFDDSVPEYEGFDQNVTDNDDDVQNVIDNDDVQNEVVASEPTPPTVIILPQRINIQPILQPQQIAPPQSISLQPILNQTVVLQPIVQPILQQESTRLVLPSPDETIKHIKKLLENVSNIRNISKSQQAMVNLLSRYQDGGIESLANVPATDSSSSRYVDYIDKYITDTRRTFYLYMRSFKDALIYTTKFRESFVTNVKYLLKFIYDDYLTEPITEEKIRLFNSSLLWKAHYDSYNKALKKLFWLFYPYTDDQIQSEHFTLKDLKINRGSAKFQPFGLTSLNDPNDLTGDITRFCYLMGGIMVDNLDLRHGVVDATIEYTAEVPLNNYLYSEIIAYDRGELQKKRKQIIKTINAVLIRFDIRDYEIVKYKLETLKYDFDDPDDTNLYTPIKFFFKAQAHT